LKYHGRFKPPEFAQFSFVHFQNIIVVDDDFAGGRLY